MTGEERSPKNRIKRVVRLVLRVVLVLIVVVLLLVLAINIPSVQTYLAQKLIGSIREKTGAALSLGTVRIALPRTVVITDLFVPDQQKDTLLYLHSLKADLELTGLISNRLSIRSLELENIVAHVARKQSDPHFNFQYILDYFSSSDTEKVEKPTAPWTFTVKEISLNKIHGSFDDANGGTHLTVGLNRFYVDFDDFNPGKKRIAANQVMLQNAIVSLTDNQADTIERSPDSPATSDPVTVKHKTKTTVDFLSGWNISAGRLHISGSAFSFDQLSSVKIPEGIDYAHLEITRIQTGMHDVELSPDGLKGIIDTLSLKEGSGLNLEKLSCQVELTEHKAGLEQIEFRTSRSNLAGNAQLSYSAFNDLIENPGHCESNIDFRKSEVNTEDVILFVPALATNPHAAKFRHSIVSIAAKVKGRINDLDVERLQVSALQKTTLDIHGKLTGLPDVQRFRFDVTVNQFSSALPDVTKFVDAKTLAGLNLPETFDLKGRTSGSIDSLHASMVFSSGYGTLDIQSLYYNSRQNRDTLFADFNAQHLLVGKITGQSQLGELNGSCKGAIGRHGKAPINASADLYLDDVEFNSYRYQGLDIRSRMENDSLYATIASSDTSMSFNLDASASFLAPVKKYSVTLDLSRMDMQALHFTQQEIAVSTQLNASFEDGGSRHSKGNLHMTQTRLNTGEKKIPVELLDFNVSSDSLGLEATLHSDLADGTVHGNIPADSLVSTMLHAFRKYLGKEDSQTLIPGHELTLNMNMHVPVEILQLAEPKLENLVITKLEGSYHSTENDLSFILDIPKASYSGVNFDTINLVLNGKNETLSLDLRCDKLSNEKFLLENLQIKEEATSGKIKSEISTGDGSDSLTYLFANEMEFGKDYFRLKFLTDGLVLDGQPWQVQDGNEFEVQKKKEANGKPVYRIRNFVFTNGDQSFGIVQGNASASSYGIEFKNFTIANITNLVTYQNRDVAPGKKFKLLQGELDGKVVFPTFPDLKGIDADLSLNNLTILDTLAGNLKLHIVAEEEKMTVDARLENKENKIQVAGAIRKVSSVAEPDLTVTVDLNNLQRLEHFTLGTLSQARGRMNGNFTVRGTLKNPEMVGSIAFHETAFRINSLNLYTRMTDEKISVDQKGIHFDDFVVEDTVGKKLTVNGDILSNPNGPYILDLKLSTKKFQPINSTHDDNKVFYGKLSMEADVTLKGTLKKPAIEADLFIDSTTSLTYALPGSELKLVTPEGIVLFVDSSKAFDTTASRQLDIMTDSLASKLKGITLKAHLEIDPGADLTIDVDPKSGDYLKLSGRAKLDIVVDEKGKQSINGLYEVKSGNYQLSFYDLVKKNFTIREGSTVLWSGKPMDAELNITAEYVVRASSVALVANESATMSDEEKKLFNKRLPYEIKLNIRGLLSRPDISFNITLPNQYMSENPLVAAKLTQLNSADMKEQLNKQVFALLVAGSFMAENPMATTGSSSSMASTAARNSVNGILAGQLNNMSGKYISGVDVNFGLTSYEDYANSSGDVRTEMDIQVSKKLFNERVTVEAENSFGLTGTKKEMSGNASQQGYGQFAVIYSITPSGEYKLRAYYQDSYDPFDGDITFSGIAILFEKDFDRLFHKDETKKKETEKPPVPEDEKEK